LSVTASYVDNDNFNESVSSAVTTVVLATTTNSNKPNILLIIADDQGLDSSAQYSFSNDVPNTPTLDALAAKGITFDNAWATPSCTTTRGSLITGQHGVHSGISFVPAIMDSSTNTLQRYLKSLPNSSDYQTAVIGKWHLGGANPDLSHPTNSGVDYYAGTITGVLTDYYNWTLTQNGQQTTSTEYHTTKITDLAIDWLAAQNQQDKPWFLWLAYVAPHSPFHLPPANLHNRTNLTGTSDDINTHKRDYYLAAIEAMDSEIGRLLASLPQDKRDNTLIVYIGDNGTPAAVIDTRVYDRTHSKNTLYEGGIRIPMVVSGKSVTRQGVHETALVNTTDFYATFASFAGNSISQINDSYSFLDLLTTTNSTPRNYNYSEFTSSKDNEPTGWVIRDFDHKLIEYADGSQELYNISDDLNETTDLLQTNTDTSAIVSNLKNQALTIRDEQSSSPIDITNSILTKHSTNCADYVERYQSSVMDVNNSTVFNGSLQISLANGKCIFQSNNIPNHDFNDGTQSFPNNVSAQSNVFTTTATPTMAASSTAITLATDNAILLNGVKVDLLAAACFGVGDGKIGCNDINQAWRYDPLFSANSFKVDTHNAHSQPDGSYHYHGKPNALYEDNNASAVSPVVGFAADGYPIFGPYIDDNGSIRKAFSSFRLKAGSRPSGSGDPGGNYDGTYRDDYEYQAGYGDLDECNGMTVNGVYGYYITDGFPYILTCFKGTPDSSFNK
jgi:arylsulfatase A-like enzyme